jgi:hypothetical protein
MFVCGRQSIYVYSESSFNGQVEESYIQILIPFPLVLTG